VSSQAIKNLTPILSQSDPNLDKTASQISDLRKKLLIPQKQLASEMGISISYLCDLEAGKRNWNMELFNKAKLGFERLSK
jgi:predicted transcriptional regulator